MYYITLAWFHFSQLLTTEFNFECSLPKKKKNNNIKIIRKINRLGSTWKQNKKFRNKFIRIQIQHHKSTTATLLCGIVLGEVGYFLEFFYSNTASGKKREKMREWELWNSLKYSDCIV